LEKKFGAWAKLPRAFIEFAKSHPEWNDVVALIHEGLASRESQRPKPPDKRIGAVAGSKRRNLKLHGQATFGRPINFRALAHAPTNEQGVIFLFGIVAHELDYRVEAIQLSYPDCLAKRKIHDDRWQDVRIEFEFESKNFDHPTDGCDVIVCWRDNWPDRPENLEVLELSKEIKNLRG